MKTVARSDKHLLYYSCCLMIFFCSISIKFLIFKQYSWEKKQSFDQNLNDFYKAKWVVHVLLIWPFNSKIFWFNCLKVGFITNSFVCYKVFTFILTFMKRFGVVSVLQLKLNFENHRRIHVAPECNNAVDLCRTRPARCWKVQRCRELWPG